MTVARVAEGLGVSWNTANDAVLAEGRRVLIEDPHRFDVRVIDVDEHCLRHTWTLRHWRGLLYRVRYVYRAAAALICLGQWIHRIPTWRKHPDTSLTNWSTMLWAGSVPRRR